MADFATGWNVPVQTLDGFDQSYIDTVLTQGTAGTGCFGMRIMWNTIARLSARLGMLHPEVSGDLERLQIAFGPMGFIHLARVDKVAEANSLTIAEQSGLWHRNADGSEMERLSWRPDATLNGPHDFGRMRGLPPVPSQLRRVR